MKLMSMTDFVIELDSTEHWSEDFTKCVNYANFLKQPLELWMFVTCNEVGEPYPKEAEEYFKYKSDGLALKYHQEKEKVLFEGFKLLADTKTAFTVINENKNQKLLFNKIAQTTLEDCIYLDLELTENAVKQIGD